MKAIAPLFFILALVIQGCATDKTASATPEPRADSRPCVANYSSSGGFWAGEQIRTFEDFPRASKAIVFDSLVATFVSKGFQIANTNKESGTISTLTGVRFGTTAPVNAVIKSTGANSVRVELILTARGGLIVHTDAAQNLFCELLASVTQRKDESSAAPQPASRETATTTKDKAQKKK